LTFSDCSQSSLESTNSSNWSSYQTKQYETKQSFNHLKEKQITKYYKHMTNIWQIYDKYMTNIWQIYDKYMANIALLMPKYCWMYWYFASSTIDKQPIIASNLKWISNKGVLNLHQINILLTFWLINFLRLEPMTQLKIRIN
jgi:hypothetical protein